MTKEEILNRITSEVGNTSLSSRSLSDYVDRIMPSGEPDDAFFTTHVAILKSVSGQMNHDIAAAVDKFKKEYKPEPKTQSAETQEAQPSTKNDDEMAKRLEALEALIKKNETERSNMQFRSSANNAAVGIGVSNQALWNDCVAQTSVAEGETDTTFIAKVKATYEAKQKAYFGEGARPYGGTKSTEITDKENESLRSSYKEALRKSGKLPNAQK